MEETTTVSTTQYIRLPDNSYAALDRRMDYGQVVTIFLLVALLFLKAVEMWQRGRLISDRTAHTP